MEGLLYKMVVVHREMNQDAGGDQGNVKGQCSSLDKGIGLNWDSKEV